MGYEIQELFPIQKAKQPLEMIASITVNRTYCNHGNDKDNQGRSCDSPFNRRFPVSWYTVVFCVLYQKPFLNKLHHILDSHSIL